MTYSGTVLADSPTLYSRQGDASGTTATDSSGNGHNGTYSNSPTLGATGLLTGDADTAVTYNGTNQFCTFAHGAWMDQSDGLPFSVEFWFKTTQTGTIRVLATRHVGTGGQFQITMTSGTITFTTFSGSSGSTAFTTTGTYNDGVRHHLVATYTGHSTGATGKLYIDGSLLGSGTVPIVTGASTGGITLAAREGPTFLVAATLDEFAYYVGTELSATRVTAHHDAGVGGATVSGTASAALGGMTASATGVRTRIGTASASLGGLTAAVAGVRTTPGSATAALGGMTASTTGVRTGFGTATAPLGGLTGQATAVPQVSGTAAAPLGPLTAAATGDHFLPGTAAAGLGSLTGTVSGVRVVVGTADANLGPLTAAATGSVAIIVDAPLLDFGQFEVLTPAAVSTPVKLGGGHVQWGFLVHEGEVQGGGAP